MTDRPEPADRPDWVDPLLEEARERIEDSEDLHRGHRRALMYDFYHPDPHFRRPATDAATAIADLDDDLDQARVLRDATPAVGTVIPNGGAPAPVSAAQLLTIAMRPMTRVITRVRRAERAVATAATPSAHRHAVNQLARIRREMVVATVLAADLDAERDRLRPVIQAALAGTDPRWRLCRGRIIDEKGRALEPMCIRPWQQL